MKAVMNKNVLITRPEPDASYFADYLAGYFAKRFARSTHSNFASIKYPLTEIIFASDVVSKIKKNIPGAQAVVMTSANALRASLPPEISSLPIFTVGLSTADEARRAGFDKIIAAQNDVASLAREIMHGSDAQAGALLYLTAHHRAGDLASCLAHHGFEVREVELYEARAATELSPPIIEAFQSGEITHVSFFSSRAAEIFALLARQHELSGHFGDVRAVCLARSSAEPLAGLGFGDVRIAAARKIEAMCDLIASC